MSDPYAQLRDQLRRFAPDVDQAAIKPVETQYQETLLRLYSQRPAQRTTQPFDDGFERIYCDLCGDIELWRAKSEHGQPCPICKSRDFRIAKGEAAPAFLQMMIARGHKFTASPLQCKSCGHEETYLSQTSPVNTAACGRCGRRVERRKAWYDWPQKPKLTVPQAR